MKTRITLSLLSVVVSLGMSACGSAMLGPTPTPTLPPYTLKCDIGAKEYSIAIEGESGGVTTEYNNEATQIKYANGVRETITLNLDRTLTYKDSNHTYKITGQIVVNAIEESVVSYEITATGSSFGGKEQKCKNP